MHARHYFFVFEYVLDDVERTHGVERGLIGQVARIELLELDLR